MKRKNPSWFFNNCFHCRNMCSSAALRSVKPKEAFDAAFECVLFEHDFRLKNLDVTKDIDYVELATPFER